MYPSQQEIWAPEHMASYSTEDAGVAGSHSGNHHRFHWVRCVCGWSWMISAKRWSPSALISKWEEHAYTAEDQSILRELGGDEWPDG
jgi:hypothetical protein